MINSDCFVGIIDTGQEDTAMQTTEQQRQEKEDQEYWELLRQIEDGEITI